MATPISSLICATTPAWGKDALKIKNLFPCNMKRGFSIERKRLLLLYRQKRAVIKTERL